MEQPAAAEALPRYEYARLRLLPHLVMFGLSLLLGWRRSFAGDGALLMQANPFPRRVEGLEHVPRTGTFVLLMNHFDRPGLHPYHCAMMVSCFLRSVRPDASEVRWTFTSELHGRRIGPFPIPLPLIRWVFRRIAKVYNLVVMPRREELVMGRAAALRTLLRALDEAPVGITPEARGSGRLVEPPRGSGLFLLVVARRGVPFLPVAVWEEGITLVFRFGPPFHLSLPEGLARDEADRLARERVMTAIGVLMPPDWWGEYAEAVARASATPEAGRG
ncbi:MAG TPA: hypothetical protein VNL95_03450 [Dehalococcoidia bacterium]|nr:hypothetical protein [Dehalococcoidia bacterium]